MLFKIEKHLFIGLAKRSTGEATYTIRQLKRFSSDFNIELWLNYNLKDVADSYIGIKKFHNITENPFKEILDALYNLFCRFSSITLIDLNCFFLENNIKASQRDDFFDFLEKISNKEGIRILIVDYFGSYTSTLDEMNTRLNKAKERLEKKIEGIPLNNRISYYLRKFVIHRMEMQLFPPLDSAFILRPVPLNKIENHSRVINYKNNLESFVARKQEKRKTIFLGLSRFFEYTVEYKIIRDLVSSVIQEIKKSFPIIDQVVCVDPFFSLTSIEMPRGVNLKTYQWIENKNFNDILENSLFVGLFVPYGTVGTIALSKGVPFISFHASMSSVNSEFYKKMLKGHILPGFNALGVWEDEVYFPDLMVNNPYFNSVFFVDLCNPQSFLDLKDYIESGKSEIVVAKYQKWFENLNVYELSSFFGKTLMEDLNVQRG
ncbi:MAG: hypothetical protein N2Z76_05550 [Treponemataceae bacterium]|nr:hypothetical protein [Treponemataceae bacterium]